MHDDRVYEIDLLRFLAAVAVVMFHWAFRGAAADGLSQVGYPWLVPLAKYGYLGVELFFMISGFVILMSASSGSVRGFVISRLVRLYPAFWACCTLTLLCAWVLADPRFVFTIGQYAVNLSMLSEFFGVQPIDGAYWSLFVEIRFYGLVTLILAVGWIRRAEPLLWVWLGINLLQHFGLRTGPLWDWLIAEYAPFFIAGAMCFLIREHGPSLKRYALIVVAWGLALQQATTGLEASGHRYNTSFDPIVVAAIVTVFFAVMLGAAGGAFGWLRRPIWMTLGVLTYPLYLLHQNIGYMVFNRWYGQVNIHLLFWGAFVGILLTALSVHRAVERPMARRMKTLLQGLFSHGSKPLKSVDAPTA